MKTNNHSEIGWHMILGAIVFLMLVPIVFALSNSFKTCLLYTSPSPRD